MTAHAKIPSLPAKERHAFLKRLGDPTITHSQLAALCKQIPTAASAPYWLQVASNPACPPEILLVIPDIFIKSHPMRRLRGQMAIAWAIAENPALPLLLLEEPLTDSLVELLVQRARMRWSGRDLTLKEQQLIFAEMAEEWIPWLRHIMPDDCGARMEMAARLVYLRGGKKNHFLSEPGGEGKLIPICTSTPSVQITIDHLNSAFGAAMCLMKGPISKAILSLYKAKVSLYPEETEMREQTLAWIKRFSEVSERFADLK